MAKVIKKTIDIILILVIVIMCLYIALRCLNKVLTYNIKTGSMEANIHAGDYVLILKKKEYNIGDVVTFEKEGNFITHRIVRIDGNVVTTKGDANNVEDDTIDAKSIIGKVIMSGGILNFIIQNKYLVVGMLFAAYLFSCYFADEREKEVAIEENISDIGIKLSK